MFNCVFAEGQRRQLISLDLESTGLTNHGVLELEKHLQMMPSLQHLNLSDNHLLRLMSFSFMNYVATLKSFLTNDCNLLLPPMDVLKGASEDRLDLMRRFLESTDFRFVSGANLSRRDADAVAQWLPHFPDLKRVDISDNTELGVDGVVTILSVLTGMSCGSGCLLIFPFCSHFSRVTGSTTHWSQLESHWFDARTHEGVIGAARTLFLAPRS
jgi:hypothetical protein